MVASSATIGLEVSPVFTPQEFSATLNSPLLERVA